MLTKAVSRKIPKALGGRGGNYLPTEGLLLKILEPDMVDSIGLLSSETYADIDPLLQSIVSADGGATIRTTAEIITLILASPYKNQLGLMGSEAKGWALYIKTAATSTLIKAYKYFDLTYPVAPYFTAAPVTGNLAVTFNLSLGAGKTVVIRWGDGTDTTVTGPVVLTDYAHTYTAGTYEIQLLGDYTSISNIVCNNSILSGDVAGFKNLAPLGNVDFSGTGVSGDIAQLAAWPTTSEVYFYDTGITSCSAVATLFPDATDIQLWNCTLNATSVDNILVAVSGTSEVNGNLRVEGEFSAAPGAAGLAAKDLLVADGWTVTVTDNGLLDLALLWTAQDGLDSVVGPDALFVSAGSVADGAGGLVAANVLPVHTDAGGFESVFQAPAYTNKCTCRKANPVDTTNVTKSGDAASVLSVVDDTAALAAAGLSGICTSGKVYKLDNSAGSVVANAPIGGTVGNVNRHTLSAYIRGGTGQLFDGSSADGVELLTTTASYVLKRLTVTPSSTGQAIVIRINAGQTVFFILPQLVESPYLLPTIVAAGDPLATASSASSAGTTGGNGLSWPMTGSANADRLKACFSGGAMTAAVLVKMGVGSAEVPINTTINGLSGSNAETDIIYARKDSSGNDRLTMAYDKSTSVQVVGSWPRYEYHRKVVRVSAAGTQYQVGNQRLTEAMVPIDSAIVWGSLAAYDGSFNPLNSLIAGLNLTVPQWIALVQVWDKEATEAEILEKFNDYYPQGA